MTPLSQAQKRALAAVYSFNDGIRITWQTAFFLRRNGLICGRYALHPARVRLPSQWKVTAAGALLLANEAKP